MYNNYNDENYLAHYGVKGMKWGIRRYMNADGSLTPAGKKRYANDDVGRAKLAYKSANKEYKKSFNKASNYSSLHPITQFTSKKKKAESDRRWEDAANKAEAANKAKSDYKQIKKANSNPSKTAIKTGTALAGAALATYGTYKLYNLKKK